MTTTSRRPPATTSKGRPRRRPADGAPAAPAKPGPPKPASPRRPSAKTTGTTGTAKGATAPKRATRPAATAPAKAAPTKAAPKKTAPTRTGAKAPTSGSRRAAARRTQAPPRTPFVLLIVGLLGGALVSLLLLNTVLAKDAFTLTRLQQSTKQLEQQRQAYEAEIARESSPEGLANKAKALGMKEAEDPAFFHTETGRAGDGDPRRVPDADAAAAGAAGVVGVPGTVAPGAGVPPAAGGAGQGGRAGGGAP